MSPHDLRLFGVIHADRAGKVTAELDEYARDVDAVFVEHPMEPFDLRLFARGFVRVPLFFVGYLCYSFLLYHLLLPLTRALMGTEVSAVRALRDEHGVPVHQVDEHPVEMIVNEGSGRLRIAANWAVLLLLAVSFPLVTVGTIATAAGILVAVRLLALADRRLAVLLALPTVWAGAYLLFFSGLVETWRVQLVILSGMLAFAITVRRTLGPRNEHMLDRIEEIAAREGYETGCLVTGKAHLSGVTAAAEGRDLRVSRSRVSKWLRRSDHEVADPDPDSGDWSDRVGGARPTRSVPERAPDRDAEDVALSARTAARLIDIVVFLCLIPVGALLGGVLAGVALGDSSGAGFLAGAVLLPALYTPLAEVRYGRTLGKRLAGLVVTKADGTPCTTGAAVVRNLVRPVDLLLFYGVGLVAVFVTDRGQRLGDLAAGTVVVRANAGDGRNSPQADRRPAEND